MSAQAAAPLGSATEDPAAELTQADIERLAFRPFRARQDVRTHLTQVARAYGDVRAERDRLRDEVARLEASGGETETLREERDRLRERIARLEADTTAQRGVRDERDRLRGELDRLRRELAAAEQAATERAVLEETIARLEADLAAERAVVGEAVVAGMRAAEALRAAARAEADTLVSNARDEAAAIRAAVEDERRRSEAEALQLRQLIGRLRTDAGAVLGAMLAQLQRLPTDEDIAAAVPAEQAASVPAGDDAQPSDETDRVLPFRARPG